MRANSVLGIVLINYFSEEELIDYIHSQLTKIDVEFKIVVVNNSDSYKSREKLKTSIASAEHYILDKDIFIITSGENAGYAKANNLGASFLKEKFEISYLLFSNTDIKFKDNNVVQALISRLDALGKEVAVIGPRIIGLDGLDQSPHNEIKFSRFFLWNTFPFLRGRFKLLQKKSHNSPKSNVLKETYCYWVSGCFFVAKAKDFFEINMFDENTFLYGEEKILAERLLRINKRHYYYPKVSILHEQGKTTKDHLKEKRINKMVAESDYYYYKQYKNVNSLLLKFLKIIKS